MSGEGEYSPVPPGSRRGPRQIPAPRVASRPCRQRTFVRAAQDHAPEAQPRSQTMVRQDDAAAETTRSHERCFEIGAKRLREPRETEAATTRPYRAELLDLRLHLLKRLSVRVEIIVHYSIKLSD